MQQVVRASTSLIARRTFLRAHCSVQIRAAMGKTLRFKQEDIKLKVWDMLHGCFLVLLTGDTLCTALEDETLSLLLIWCRCSWLCCLYCTTGPCH